MLNVKISKKLWLEQQNIGGLLQEIQVPTLMWEDIDVGFVVRFPRTQRQYDSIWVVVDKLSKSTNFIHVRFTYSL